MSKLIDDLQNLANEADADERAAQAARIDACIDELVRESGESDGLKKKIDDLEQERDAALKRGDEFRDRFVDIYFKQNEAAPAEPPQKNDTMENVIKGASALCGGWKKG